MIIAATSVEGIRTVTEIQASAAGITFDISGDIIMVDLTIAVLALEAGTMAASETVTIVEATMAVINGYFYCPPTHFESGRHIHVPSMPRSLRALIAVRTIPVRDVRTIPVRDASLRPKYSYGEQKPTIDNWP